MLISSKKTHRSSGSIQTRIGGQRDTIYPFPFHNIFVTFFSRQRNQIQLCQLNSIAYKKYIQKHNFKQKVQNLLKSLQIQ